MSEESLTEVAEESAKSDAKTQKESSPLPNASSGEREVGSGPGKRDMGVSTLMHLMGVASSRELHILENKIDALTSKITSLGLKIERVSKVVSQTHDESYLDRIDFQLADIRNLFKKLFPKAYAMGESETEDTLSDNSAAVADEVAKAQESSGEGVANGQLDASTGEEVEADPVAGAS